MAIDLRDYQRTAAQRGWGAGWPSCNGAKAAGTAVVTADRSGTRFSVHKRIARLVDLISDECERRGYLFKSGQTGGYNCRAIGGTSSPSNHSWGLAIDVNWRDNPYTTDLSRNTIPEWMVELFNRYGFAWGGHYSGARKDFMHFEFMGTPEQADEMTALALRELLDGDTTPAADPTVLRRGDSGPAVGDLQRRLGIEDDDDFGPDTERAVRAFQAANGLIVDGIAGPATLAALASPSTATTSEEDGLNADEKLMLTLIYQQLAGHGSEPGQFTGWPTWAGGTNERLTLIDLARRSNVETRQAWLTVQGLRGALDKLAEVVARPTGTPGAGLTAAEIKQAVTDAIAEGLVQVDVRVTGPS